ncbi:MAG TPA: transketolase C-terminal domain-containing protein [Anaerolineales bacterium]|nr:transketolase C-terminal domain-containing protein [Anaerolineales bacterium]
MTTVVEAINAAIHTCLAESPEVVFLGEDVLDPYGGAFKVARGLSSAFPGRVVTTPVSEAGIVGMGIGMALRGLRPIVEIMFGDFLALACDQLLNHASKLRWMSNDKLRVPLVLRTPMGGRRGYGPTHSQSLEKHFLGAPGLRTVAITWLDDPARLLRSAVLEDDDPVLFIEHKLLYSRPVQPLDALPEFNVERFPGRYPLYRLTLEGAPPPTLTMAAYGGMAEVGMQAVRRLAYELELFCELLVYTELSPLSMGPLLDRLHGTQRLLTLEEGTLTLGWGAEVAARAAEGLPGSLRVARVAARDLPIPASGPLEAAVLPQVEDVMRAGLKLGRDE